MARLYADADGVLIGAQLSDAEASAISAPAIPAWTIVIDETTNPVLVRRLRQSFESFRLIGAVLTENGQPVVIVPPDPVVVERTAATDDLRTTVQQMLTDLNAIIARNGTFTQAQAGQALDVLAKVVKRIVRKLAADAAQAG